MMARVAPQSAVPIAERAGPIAARREQRLRPPLEPCLFARKQAIGYLVPGVILQPSGVFAAIRAQEAGATYLRAS